MNELEIINLIKEWAYRADYKNGMKGYELSEQELKHVAETIVKKFAISGVVKSLKDKWDITFEQWTELYWQPYNATYMTNKHGILKTKKELRKYFDEFKQTL